MLVIECPQAQSQSVLAIGVLAIGARNRNPGWLTETFSPTIDGNVYFLAIEQKGDSRAVAKIFSGLQPHRRDMGSDSGEIYCRACVERG